MAVDRNWVLRPPAGAAWPQDAQPGRGSGYRRPLPLVDAPPQNAPGDPSQTDNGTTADYATYAVAGGSADLSAEAAVGWTGGSAAELALGADRLPFGLAAPQTRPQAAANAPAAPRGAGTMPGGDAAASMEAVFAPLVARVHGVLGDHGLPFRLATHLSVVAVAAIVLVISQIELPTWEVTLRLLPNTMPVAGSAGSRVSAFSSGALTAAIAGNNSLQRSAIPFTIAEPETTADIQYYTVQAGDTVLGIAEHFGIRPETIIWSNTGLDKHVELIRPGDQLAILPIDGAYHTVAPGDTLSTLAQKYSVSVDEILAYADNGLSDATDALRVGQKLVVPNGSRPFVEGYATGYSGPIPASAMIGSGAFVWPTSGPITQSYWGAHRGLDIGGWTGAPVKATDSGYVTLAATGWNTGYGNYVIVDHGNGFSSLYSHLNSVYVRTGESVARGQQIGSVGNTGNSTGPHLHLEIRYQGVPRNPLGYLP